MVTDIGWYPHARAHFRERTAGATEHILILCESGRGWCTIGSQSYQVESNQALLIPKDSPHSYGALEDVPWTIYWVHFSGSIADYLAHQLPANTNIFTVDRESAESAFDLFDTCYRALEDGFSAPQLIYCAQVLHHLLGVIFFRNQHFLSGPHPTRPRRIEETLQYLKVSIGKALTLADMAQHAGLSVPHFSALFKQQMGYSPMDYFIHTKIQRACSLLDTTSLNVRAVGALVGYEDPYYFSRIFRKVMGVSPRAYRYSHRTA